MLDDYPTYHHSRSTILLTLPARLRRDEVLRQCHAWSRRNGLALNRYYDHAIPFLPPLYMVQIKIHNFPLACWDVICFQHSVTPFGKLVQVHSDNVPGGDRSCLKLWIECRDPYAIPEYLFPNFSNQWCRCRIQVETWYPMGWIPPQLPPDEPGLTQHQSSTSHPQNTNTPSPTMMDLLLQCHRRVLRLWRAGVPLPTADTPLFPDDASITVRTDDITLHPPPSSSTPNQTNPTTAHNTDPTQKTCAQHIDNFDDCLFAQETQGN